MQVFKHHLLKFFNIENPLLIVSFLIIIVFSRFSITYFNDGHRVMAPDINYFAGEFVGHDLIFATTDQAYRLLKGLPMQLEVGYGYTFTILTAWIIELFNKFGICNQTNHIFCQFLFYKLVVIISLVGILSLSFLLIKNRKMLATGILFLVAFLLGVPGAMGIESGNLDILLTVLYGLMLFLQKVSLKNKSRYIYPILLGVIAGSLLQTKIFFLPIAIIFLICSTKPFTFILSLLFMVSLITIIPGFYNVPINPLYTIQAAQTLRNATGLSSAIVYGNNDTRAMVGGVVFAIPALHRDQFMQNVLINLGGALLFLLILVLPLFSFIPKLTRRIKLISLQDRLQYSFFIVLNCYTITAVILWPEISLGYRFFYLIPLIYIFLNTAQNVFAKQSIGIALSALLIRSTFIWHTRILHLFLLAFFYFFILACISIWLHSSKTVTKDTKVQKTS